MTGKIGTRSTADWRALATLREFEGSLQMCGAGCCLGVFFCVCYLLFCYLVKKKEEEKKKGVGGEVTIIERARQFQKDMCVCVGGFSRQRSGRHEYVANVDFSSFPLSLFGLFMCVHTIVYEQATHTRSSLPRSASSMLVATP